LKQQKAILDTFLENQRLLTYQFGELGRLKEALRKERDDFKLQSRKKKT